LKDSAVLVTGSSSGIGQTAAVAFGREGARVAVTYRDNREGAEETVRQVKEAAAEAIALHYNLGEPVSIRSALNDVKREWGKLNVLVNNAVPREVADPLGMAFESVPMENWASMLRMSLEGAVLTIQCALP
jgi:3-oxoacyl-[acyl-carrier protein] reductase